MSKIEKKLDQKGRIRITEIIKKFGSDKLSMFSSQNTVTIFRTEDMKRFRQYASELGADHLVIEAETQNADIDTQKRLLLGRNRYAPQLKRDENLVGIYSDFDGFDKLVLMSKEEYAKRVEKTEKAFSQYEEIKGDKNKYEERR